jgi:H+/gluconate symporter-like permease
MPSFTKVPFSKSYTTALGVLDGQQRKVATASGGFDTVPWNSFVVLILTMGQLDHKRAYMPIFWVSLVAPILISLLGIFFV